MSVFRPSVRVTGPDGSEWEVYAYRIALPSWGRDPVDVEFGGADVRSQALSGLFAAVQWLLGGAVRLGALLVWHLPRAVLRALGSEEWTIEAVTWQPHRTSLAWRTTREYRGHVLAQVEGQLARGETPKPNHAQYLGTDG
ncbi:MAG TPA: hypothetical protein VJ986_03155 [Gaiellaceae bacterium]|nr:hypothetical protein [Gaiellaceae bacterium]